MPGLGDALSSGIGNLIGGNASGAVAYEKGRSLSAQTEAALAKARADIDETQAKQEYYDAARAMGMPDAQAKAYAVSVRAGRSPVELGDAMLRNQEYGIREQLANPETDPTTGQLIARGLTNGPIERYAPAGEGMLQDKFSPNAPTVTPIGQSLIDSRAATANLADARATHPERFHVTYGAASPDLQTELDKAVAEGRLDPARINSRNANILGSILKNSPGINLNRMIADAALQRNPTFQQRAMTMESIPSVMNSMVEAGKRVGFNDNRTIGKMQAFMKGEFNDPDYQEYMTIRNDALMNIANVMRGVGMSDQAHRAEIEAASPSMSPAALDAWLRGQMHSLEPRLSQQRRVTGLGGPPTVAPPAPAPEAQAAPDAEGWQTVNGIRIRVKPQ